jgi:hypothetical protein
MASTALHIPSENEWVPRTVPAAQKHQCITKVKQLDYSSACIWPRSSENQQVNEIVISPIDLLRTSDQSAPSRASGREWTKDAERKERARVPVAGCRLQAAPGLPTTEEPVTRFQLTGSLLRKDGLRCTSRRLSVDHWKAEIAREVADHGACTGTWNMEHGEDSS